MGSIELLNPRGLWLLAGIVPLIFLYILKVRRTRLRVPSTWLWLAAQRDLVAKHPFRRLVAELPLLLQLLALAAIALALARPAVRGGKVAGDHIAIIVDTSASMGAGTRMVDAKRAAADVIGAIEPGADAIVIEAAREARVVTPLERDGRHLRSAIAELAVREVEGSLQGAVALAADRLRSLGGRRRIVIVTDGASAHPEIPLAAAGADVQVLTVAPPGQGDNVAIVRIDVRSGTDAVSKRDQVQAFAMIENFGSSPRDVFVTLTIEGHAEPVASRRLLLAPKEKAPVVLTFGPAKADFGASLKIQIAPSDALALDDVAYARVPAGRRMPVTLATTASTSWLARALDADTDVDLQHITLEQLKTVNVDPDALVIVEGACPDPVPGHDVVVVAPRNGSCFGVDVLPSVEQPTLTSWETGDARLRFLTLDGVHVARATPLRAEGAGASLVRAGKFTLMGDASFPGRAVTILGFDVGESDWPLKASFVLFVRNLVEVAKLHRAQGSATPARTGDPLRVAVPPGVTFVRVEGPSLADHELPVKGGFVVIPAVERAGIYRVRWSAPSVGATTIAANLTSESESDILPRPIVVATTTGTEAANVGGSGATTATPVRAVTDAHHEWANWLALAGGVVLLLDLFWLTRQRNRTAVLRAAEGRR